MSSEPQEGAWRVEFSQAIARDLRELQLKAEREGRGAKTIEAMERIHDRMSRDPMEFGEPLYRLPVMKIQNRQAVIAPVAVDFGVCEDRPVVFVKGVKLMSLTQGRR
jgi:hypothetical protein